MNRYAALGLAHDAAAGAQILVLTERQGFARPALDVVMRAIADRGDRSDVTATLALGNEAIKFLSGGSIRFQSVHAPVRGMQASAVYLDADTADLVGRDTLRDLHLVCPTGHITRA